MQYPNLFKRIIPFTLAIVLGLFVASFFVSLTPSFSFRGKGRIFREMKEQNRTLKIEVERLRSENDELRKHTPKCDSAEFKHFKLYKDWEMSPEWKSKTEKELKKELERLERSSKTP